MRHFRTFSNPDKCQPEVAGDVISGMALEYAARVVLQAFVIIG